ncbi:FtsX-like permease family protein [Paenibacillus sp. sgz500958]|uniref:ABC transporter permease n=1 Tax=Paenibacillus sp. sgz500958 TaxID=3242475 RepID=UPI0036D3C4FE
MALLIMIIRKMIKNKWLVISLLIGMVMTSSLVSTMPVYSEAILSRMLVKDLEQLQLDYNTYPASHYTKLSFSEGSMDKRLKTIDEMDSFMKNTAAPGFQLPLRELVSERITKFMQLQVEGAAANPKKLKPTAGVKSASGIEEHVKLVDGRLPSSAKNTDGVYEVMVNQRTLQEFNFILGNIIKLDDNELNLHLRVKPVGLFQKKDDDDLYFRDPLMSDYNRVFVMNENLFQKELVEGRKAAVSLASWYFVLDYSRMELSKVDPFLQTVQLIQDTAYAKVLPYQADFDVPATKTIEQYFERSERLSLLMWSLNIPVLIMLGFYMFMVSNLIVDRQKNEIAVLRSRGAARWQIVLSFAIEGLILSAAALAAGPFIATLLTRVLGASNGFLEFVQRASLPVHLSAKAFRYAGAAAGVSWVMMLIPVIRATRVTIVGHKQQQARLHKTPLWHKSFLDVLLLAISGYGLFSFRKRLSDLQSLGLQADDLRIDPLQFVVPALFIVGGGLLLLRLYPLLLRLIYRLGRSFWPPSWYATLIQVGRASSQYQFLMIFLIITIATGVFSAGAARTVNNNTEERIRYKNGADFTLSGKWPSDAAATPAGGGAFAGAAGGSATPITKSVHYTEPPYDPYLKLPGVEHAAKVFVKENAVFKAGDGSGRARLMGIDSDDFGATAWFQNELLHYPFSDYLNLIAPDSRAVLISSTLADQNKLKAGDTLWVSWDDISPQPFIVYGILPYFPTFNPNPAAGTASSDSEEASSGSEVPMLIVGHLSRIQLQLALEPYQVWIKMKPEVSTAAFYQGIEKSDIPLNQIINTREELVRAKNDPFLMALNGILTLGFLISILVTFVGFLLYWMLSLKGRTLQNGIMRAIGLSLRQLIGMLALEQLLTSGTALLIGVIVGNVTSRLFVPNFQIAFNPGSLVPPFRVVFASGDFARLYLIVGFTLLLGLGVLGYMLSRIRIHQALKLGED